MLNRLAALFSAPPVTAEAWLARMGRPGVSARDQAALDAHGKSDHMAAFQEFMGANPPEASDLRIYDTDEGQPLR